MTLPGVITLLLFNSKTHRTYDSTNWYFPYLTPDSTHCYIKSPTYFYGMNPLVVIKYAQNTLMSVRMTEWHKIYNRKILLFCFRKRKPISCQCDSECWRMHMHCDWWRSEHHDECFLTVIIPCLVESLSGNLTFWQLTYAITDLHDN